MQVRRGEGKQDQNEHYTRDIMMKLGSIGKKLQNRSLKRFGTRRPEEREDYFGKRVKGENKEEKKALAQVER